MGVVSAYTAGVRVALDQPLVPATAAAFALLTGVLQFLQFLSPAGQAVASAVGFFVAPFVMGGLYGLAGEAFDGRPDPATFLAAGRANYVRLLGAYVLFVAIVFAITLPLLFVGAFVVLFAGLFVVVALTGTGSGGSVALLVGAFALGLFVLTLPALVVGALLGFYDAAVVFDDEGVTDALRRSYRLARTRTANVLAYAAVRYVLSLVGSVPVMYFLLSRTYDAPGTVGTGGGAVGGDALAGGTGVLGSVSVVEMAPYVALTVAVTAVTMSILYPAHVAYYRDLRAAADDGADGAAGGADAAATDPGGGTPT